MANKKISQLTTNVSPLVTDLFATVNSGITKKITLSGLTSYFQNNLIFQDMTITGGTFSNNTLTLVDNSGNTVSVTGFTDNDIFVTGGTYTAGTATFRNNTGGTFSVSGFSTGGESLLFGFTDSAATEDRIFNISGHSFSIEDSNDGVQSYITASDSLGFREIYMQAKNPVGGSQNYVDFGLYVDGSSRPSMYYDAIDSNNGDSAGLYLEPNLYSIYLQGSANLNLDGIANDSAVTKILALDVNRNVRTINKSEIAFPLTYFTGIVDYGSANVNLTLDYPTGGTGLSVYRTGSLNFNPGDVFLADAYGIHLPQLTFGLDATTGATEVLALDGTLNNLVTKRKVAMEQYTPSSSADTNGFVGQFTYDNDNIYVKSNTGWFKSKTNNFDLPSFNTLNTASIAINGDGSADNPLYATSLIPTVTNGIINGGDVTWISGYTYSVSPATYYINSVLYSSPYTQLTLASADTVNNRIDVFVLTISGAAAVVTGTAATNPEQPSINTATQIQNSFALVIANSTSPSVGREFVYLENTEWTSSATTNFNVASTNNPYSGTVDVEATTLVAGNTVSFTRSTAFQPLLNRSVLILYIRSKATWNSNRSLSFTFRNGTSVIGTSVSIGGSTTTYGFNSSITNAYQRIVIPLSDFNLTPSDTVDRLFISAAGTGGVMGFYLDNIELQGANPTPTVIGTTDNTGVFYVNKNYSGTGGTVVSGFTIATIYSSNAGYNSQLIQARMGDMNKAYPCPWSARNAAMEAMTGGVITKAYIKVLGGSQYTIGSPTASLNGGISGETATTVADVAFASGTDISSLLKNNIFYNFEENTKLIWINRSGQYYLGYNVDATHTAFKSAIFGNCDLIQVFDEAPGRGGSQRGFRFSNSRGDYRIDCNTIMSNGYFFVDIIHKSFISNVKTNYLTKRGSLVGLTNAASENEGDGSPSITIVNVENLYKGPQYFPYISISGASGQPIFAMDCSSAVRSKYITFNVKNLFIKQHSSQDIYTAFITPINRNVYNWFMTLNVENLQQDNDAAELAILGGSLPMISTLGVGDVTSRVRDNFHEVFNIKQAYINNTLARINTYNSKNAASKNTSIIFNSDEIIKLSMVGTPSSSFFYSDAIFGLPAPQANQGITHSGEKTKVQINVGQATAVSGSVFTNSGFFESAGFRPVYQAATTIRGTYITNAGSPVMILNGTGHTFVLDNVTFISKSSATETISVDNDSNPVYIYGKNADLNLSASTAATQYGTFITNSELNNFL